MRAFNLFITEPLIVPCRSIVQRSCTGTYSILCFACASYSTYTSRKLTGVDFLSTVASSDSCHLFLIKNAGAGNPIPTFYSKRHLQKKRDWSGPSGAGTEGVCFPACFFLTDDDLRFFFFKKKNKLGTQGVLAASLWKVLRGGNAMPPGSNPRALPLTILFGYPSRGSSRLIRVRRGICDAGDCGRGRAFCRVAKLWEPSPAGSAILKRKKKRPGGPGNARLRAQPKLSSCCFFIIIPRLPSSSPGHQEMGNTRKKSILMGRFCTGNGRGMCSGLGRLVILLPSYEYYVRRRASLGAFLQITKKRQHFFSIRFFKNASRACFVRQ